MKFFNFRIIIFLLILLSRLATCAMPSQQALNLIREQQRNYGKQKETHYEYANFLDLRLLDKTVQSYEIYQFLNLIKCNVSDLWQDAIDSVFSERTQIIDTQIWPEKFIDQVSKIEIAINNAFDKYIRGLEKPNEKINVDSISKLRDFLAKFLIITTKSSITTHFDLQPSAFLELVPTPSTSSQQRPNPAYITKNFPVDAVILEDPTLEQFIDGIRKAILSYFKFSCLAIRLQAGDKVIFEKPETPIKILINPATREIMILAFPEVSQDMFLKEISALVNTSNWQRLGEKAFSLYYKSFAIFFVFSQGLSLYRACCQESIPSLRQRVREMKEHDVREFQERENKINEARVLLGVGVDATHHEIEKAYRKAWLKYHPDKHGDSEIFKKLEDMRETLMSAASE